MTNIETRLLKFASRFKKGTYGFGHITLCRYYDDNEERAPGIPDILDTLDARVDGLLGLTSDNFKGYIPEQRIEYAQGRAKDILAMRRKIENQNSLYYLIDTEGSSVWECRNVTMPIMTPYTEDGFVKWKDTGETVKVFKILDLRDEELETRDLIPADDDIPCDVIFCDHNWEATVSNLSTKFGYVGFAEFSGVFDNYYTCKEPNCGRIFSLTYKEIEWFKYKGWPLPKRCPACRAERKQAREQMQAERTSLFN